VVVKVDKLNLMSTFHIIEKMAEEFPKIEEKSKGKFTRLVKKNMPGKSTCAAASSIMNNKDSYDEDVVKMANYANNFGCKKK